VQLVERAAQVRARLLAGELRERIPPRFPALLDVGAPLLGQRDELAPAAGRGGDEALVLQQGDGRVDPPGAGAPRATGPVGDRLHDLVAVHRLLREQQQRRDAHVATLRATAAEPATAARPALAAPAPAAVRAVLVPMLLARAEVVVVPAPGRSAPARALLLGAARWPAPVRCAPHGDLLRCY
jgi:hypothetical protein